MNELFFELIRVGLGSQTCLSMTPSEAEWDNLYGMALKQSLVGICFVGLQQLGADADAGFVRIGMSEKLYFSWMVMAAQIQQRNEVVNRHCVEVQQMFKEKGVRSCIIKGQGTGALYNVDYYEGRNRNIDSDLSLYRQSGDIDIWVEGGRKKVIELVNSIHPTKEIRDNHAQLHIFKDTEVEVHYRPGLIRDFRRNRLLQEFFKVNAEECFTNTVQLHDNREIVASTVRFNAVQQLLHIYHHLFDSGIGLRQVLDYYFVLRNISEFDRAEVIEVLKLVGVERFAKALMYVEQKVFGLGHHYLLCEPSIEDGEYLLNEIIRGGNFGHYDDRRKYDTHNSFLESFLGVYFKNFRHARFAPMEWFWSPLWRLYYFGWRKWNGYE